MLFRSLFDKKPVLTDDKTVFVDSKTGSQEFDLRKAFTEPTPSSDISGFTDAPRGVFAGQDKEFKRQGIHLLNPSKTALVARGDARPLSFLFKGIPPKAPGAPVHIENHRQSSDGSGGVSYSSIVSVAIASGAYASLGSYYGMTPIPGDGSFNLIAAKISGKKYTAAGPGKIKAQESEVTVGGPVDSDDLLAYRQCKFDRVKRTALCSSIFVRTDLPEGDQRTVVDFLSGKGMTIS